MRKLKYKKFQCDTDSYNEEENMPETQIVNWININLDKIDLVSICHYWDSYAYYATVYYFDK